MFRTGCLESRKKTKKQLSKDALYINSKIRLSFLTSNAFFISHYFFLSFNLIENNEKHKSYFFRNSVLLYIFQYNFFEFRFKIFVKIGSSMFFFNKFKSFAQHKIKYLYLLSSYLLKTCVLYYNNERRVY